MRRFGSPSTVALAVLGVVTVVMVALALLKQSSLTSEPDVAAAATPPPPPPSVAFVGDGYTSGSPAGGQGPANYTALLATRDGWRVTNTAVDGAGYVATPALGAQVPKAAGAQPQLVVVTAGRADRREDPSAVRDAAGRLFTDVRDRLPQARVVVIGPMWVGDSAPRSMRAVRDAIGDAAASAKLPFVDPIAGRWFIGRDADGVTANGDLNDRGHQRLADLVDEAVRKADAMPR